MKEAAIEKLLQPPSSSSKPKGVLIQDLDGSPIEPLDPPTPPAITAPSSRQPNDDEPSMLELMMAAQKEAAIEVQQKKEAEIKAKEPSFGSGLKKGFFNNPKPSKSTSDKSKTASSTSNTTTSASLKAAKTDFDDDIIDLTNVSGKKSANTASKKDNEKFVFDDVQKALDEDQHPLLQQVKKNG